MIEFHDYSIPTPIPSKMSPSLFKCPQFISHPLSCLMANAFFHFIFFLKGTMVEGKNLDRYFQSGKKRIYCTKNILWKVTKTYKKMLLSLFHQMDSSPSQTP